MSGRTALLVVIIIFPICPCITHGDEINIVHGSPSRHRLIRISAIRALGLDRIASVSPDNSTTPQVQNKVRKEEPKSQKKKKNIKYKKWPEGTDS